MKRIQLLSRVTLGGLLVTPVGCEVGPNYTPPKINVMDDWGEQGREPTTNASTTHPSVTVSRPPALVEWWTTFNDPRLDAYIGEAMDSNLDVRIAQQRILEAREQRNYVTGALFPKVDTDDIYQHIRSSRNGIFSSGGGSSSGGSSSSGASSSGGGGPSSEFNFYQLGFDASWELDLFGGQRRAVEAANAELDAAVDSQRDTMLTLLGDVARNYIELRATQARLEIAKRNLGVEQKTLELARQQSQRGLTNELDLNRISAQVASTAAQVPPLEASIAQSIHELSILLDKRPTALVNELTPQQSLPPVPNEVPVGLPSDLLRRRPDIRRAERNIATATAQIGVATADLFPKVSLYGTLGTQAVEAGHLLDWSSRQYTLGPVVSWNLFDAGRTRSQIRLQEARQREALLTYRQTVLNAFKEVEDQLVRYGKQQERTKNLIDAVAASTRAVRIANDLYSRGLQDFVSVLDAERDLFSNEDQLAQSQSDTETTLVALYKSLGGGWEVSAMRELTATPAEERSGHAQTVSNSFSDGQRTFFNDAYRSPAER